MFHNMKIWIFPIAGLAPLCSGLKPNMVRACIYSGVQFVTYEMVKDKLLHTDRHDWNSETKH